MLDDTNLGDAKFESRQITRAMEQAMHAYAELWGMGEAWVTGAVTLVTGTGDYALPSSVQYSNVRALYRNRDGYEMVKMTFSEIQALREGTSAPTGEPAAWAPWEDTSQGVNIRLDVNPTSTYNGNTLNMLRAQVPGSLSTDSTAIPFSSGGLRALEKRVAGELGENTLWLQQAEEAAEHERVRLYRLKHTGRFHFGGGSTWPFPTLPR